MKVAIKENTRHKYEDGTSTIPVMIEERLGNKMNEATQIEHQKDDDQIEHDHDRRGA